GRCKTRDLPLDGAPSEPWDRFQYRTTAELTGRYSLSAESARHLVDRYGRRALDVAAPLERNPEQALPVVPGEPELQVEFIFQREHEMAVYAADHLLRRTRLGLFHPRLLAEGGCLD